MRTKDAVVVVVVVVVVTVTLTTNRLFLIVLSMLLQSLTNTLRFSHIKRLR